MQEPQSNLEEKLNTSILKGYFPPRTDPSIFTSIAPVFIRLVSRNQLSFSSIEINKSLPTLFHSVLYRFQINMNILNHNKMAENFFHFAMGRNNRVPLFE